MYSGGPDRCLLLFLFLFFSLASPGFCFVVCVLWFALVYIIFFVFLCLLFRFFSRPPFFCFVFLSFFLSFFFSYLSLNIPSLLPLLSSIRRLVLLTLPPLALPPFVVWILSLLRAHDLFSFLLNVVIILYLFFSLFPFFPPCPCSWLPLVVFVVLGFVSALPSTPSDAGGRDQLAGGRVRKAGWLADAGREAGVEIDRHV